MMSIYEVSIGGTKLRKTTEPVVAQSVLAEARDMQRWASRYGQAIGLTVDGQAIDTTDDAELARVGIEIA